LTPQPEQTPLDLARRVLDRIDGLLAGPSDSPHATWPAPAPATETLRRYAEETGRSLGEAAVGWLAGIADDPAGRLKGAEDAGRAFARHVAALAERGREQLTRGLAACEALRQRLAAGEPAGKAGGRWLGRGRRPETPAGLGPEFIELCLMRLEEVKRESVLEALRSVSQRVARFVQDVGLARDRLGHFADTFAADLEAETPVGTPPVPVPNLAELLPGRAPSAVEVAESVFAQLAPTLTDPLDQRLQEDVFGGLGGLWPLVSRHRDLGQLLREPLWAAARVAVLESLRDTDAARLFLEAHADPNEARRTLAAHAQAACPRLTVPGSWHHLVVALPAGGWGRRCVTWCLACSATCRPPCAIPTATSFSAAKPPASACRGWPPRCWATRPTSANSPARS
jgi:hypothetical protein